MSKTIFSILLIFLITTSTWATHLRSGYITYKRLSELTYEFTILVFTDCGADNPVLFGDGDLDFGDGSDPVIIPQINNRNTSNSEVCYASFTIEHEFLEYGNYTVGYTEANRNPDVLNINYSINTTFYIDTSLIIDQNTPELSSSVYPIAPPVFHHNYQDDLAISLAAIDSNDFTLRYELVTPKSQSGVDVDYKWVDGIEIDPISGQLTWGKEFIQQYAQGEYGFAVRVKQYQLIDQEYVYRGYFTYDFQIIIVDSASKIDISSDEVQGNLITLTEPTIDTLNYKIQADKVEVFSDLDSNNIDWLVSDTLDQNYKSLQIILNLDTQLKRDNPYTIIIRGSAESNFFISKDVTLLLYTTEPSEPVLITDIYDGITASEVNIYPNPTSQNIFINGLKKSEYFEIFDLNGENVLSGSSKGSIDIHGLEPKIYMLKIRNAIFKVVVK